LLEHGLGLGKTRAAVKGLEAQTIKRRTKRRTAITPIRNAASSIPPR
jgi:hypothetical protein